MPSSWKGVIVELQFRIVFTFFPASPQSANSLPLFAFFFSPSTGGINPFANPRTIRILSSLFSNHYIISYNSWKGSKCIHIQNVSLAFFFFFFFLKRISHYFIAIKRTLLIVKMWIVYIGTFCSAFYMYSKWKGWTCVIKRLTWLKKKKKCVSIV